MRRTFDLDGHPWPEAGRQGFRLADDRVDELCEADALRLTDRATGTRSYWQAVDLEKTPKGWRAVLSQIDPPDGEPA